MNLTLTRVSVAAVWCDGVLLVEMSDGTVAEFKCHRDPTLTGGRLYLRNLRRDQLIEECREINRQAQQEASWNLHADKVRRLGADYARRGY